MTTLTNFTADDLLDVMPLDIPDLDLDFALLGPQQQLSNMISKILEIRPQAKFLSRPLRTWSEPELCYAVKHHTYVLKTLANLLPEKIGSKMLTIALANGFDFSQSPTSLMNDFHWAKSVCNGYKDFSDVPDESRTERFYLECAAQSLGSAIIGDMPMSDQTPAIVKAFMHVHADQNVYDDIRKDLRIPEISAMNILEFKFLGSMDCDEIRAGVSWLLNNGIMSLLGLKKADFVKTPQSLMKASMGSTCMKDGREYHFALEEMCRYGIEVMAEALHDHLQDIDRARVPYEKAEGVELIKRAFGARIALEHVGYLAEDKKSAWIRGEMEL